MDDSPSWNSSQINKPAIITVPFSHEQLKCFSSLGGHHVVEEWMVDMRHTLTRLARELNQQDVTRLMALETSFLHQIVQQKQDMRSEKFFPKMKQASAATRRWLQYCTPKLLDDVSQLMKVLKKGQDNKIPEYRLVSPAVLRYVLCHLARGHGTLRQTVIYCEQAAIWMQCKMSISQRCGLVLALYSVVARIRALSLYLMQVMSSGFVKLSVLVFGVPLTAGGDDAKGRMVLDGFPKHLRELGDEQRTLGKDKRKPDLKSMLGELFNEKTAAGLRVEATQPHCGDHSEGYTETGDQGSKGVDDFDLGVAIERSPLPSTKKRKRDASTGTLSTKKLKDGKVPKKMKKTTKKVDASSSDTCTTSKTNKKKKKVDDVNTDTCIALESNNNIKKKKKKKKKKKRISGEFSVPKSPLQTSNEIIGTCSESIEVFNNVSPKTQTKNISETVPGPLFEKLGQLRKKLGSKTSLYSHVGMDPNGGANSLEESVQKAAVLKKSNSFLNSCSNLLHLPQTMSKKALSTVNLKNEKNKPKKIRKIRAVHME